MLDLDGDGVELTSVSTTEIHFDFDGDGFAERTGWVAPDDGLLVLDRNGNGQIDDGSELFGNGGTDGFDVLRELDSNEDGRFDALDAEFWNVRAWQDANSNGVTDAGELKTLASLGIASITLDAAFEGYDSAGNWVARSGSVELTNGGSSVAKSVYFATDTHATSYVVPDGFEYDPLALILPQLKGYGSVKDLAVAISEDPQLLATLKGFVLNSNGLSAGELREAVEDLVAAWASTEDAPTGGRGSYVDYEKLAVVEAFQGEPFYATELSQKHARIISERYDSIIDGLMGRLAVQLSFSYFALHALEGPEVGLLEHSLAPFSVFSYDAHTDTISGRPDFFLALATGTLSGSQRDQLARFEMLVEVGKSVSTVVFNGDHEALNDRLAGLAAGGVNFGDLALEDLSTAIARQILFGTDGNDTLMAGKGDDIFVGRAGDDILSGGGGADTYKFELGDGHDIVRDFSNSFAGSGGNDTLEFGEGIDPAEVTVTLADFGWDLVLTIGETGESVTLDGDVNDIKNRIEQVRFADGTIWTHAQLMAMALTPTAANDLLYGSTDGEMIAGIGGNDTIDGRGGNDILIGGPGNDTLYGSGGDDIYRFARGDGEDIIREYVNSFSGWGGSDMIQFGDDILPGQIVVSQADYGWDLVLTIAGTTDRIVVDNGIGGGSDYRVEMVRFADGTVWDWDELLARSLGATSGADTIAGDGNSNIIGGLGGNDVIDGRQGDDVLTGGRGDDILSGSAGNDTYVFARGDGADIVRDYVVSWSGSGGSDTIRLGEGIVYENLIVTQVDYGWSLKISIAATTDSIKLENTVNDAKYRIEQVVLFGGRVLSHAELMAMATAATAGNDTFSGGAEAESFSGGAGNDVIDGREGDDTLAGNSGNDTLYGSGGNDTYLYSRGDGFDLVQDYINGFSGWGGYDSIRFAAGIFPADVTVGKTDNGGSYVLYLDGGTGSLRRSRHLARGRHRRRRRLGFSDRAERGRDSGGGRLHPLGSRPPGGLGLSQPCRR